MLEFWFKMNLCVDGCRVRTTQYGMIPHVSYQIQKPVKLGTELKTTACGTIRIILSLEIKSDKEPVGNQEYNATHGYYTGQVL